MPHEVDSLKYNTRPDCSSDAREFPRANMFLSALLYGVATTCPVKIRDMSSIGAQIEGPGLPKVGTSVSLVRGSLRVDGQVAWRINHRCGLKFSTLVSIQQWLVKTGDQGQQRVDDIVALLKSGAIPLTTPDHHQKGRAGWISEIHRISELLRALEDDLASDELIVAKSTLRLQNLDIALQCLAVMAASMGANRTEGIDQSLGSCTPDAYGHRD